MDTEGVERTVDGWFFILIFDKSSLVYEFFQFKALYSVAMVSSFTSAVNLVNFFTPSLRSFS